MFENEFIKKQLQHRSIREFKEEAVDPEKLSAIRAVCMRTASSNGLQQASVIRVTEPSLKKKIAELGGQKYIGRAPELWVFLSDAHRNLALAKEKGLSKEPGFDTFLQGFTDAILMAQNAMSALESMDLGGVFIGSVLGKPQELIRLLHLPAGCFPALAMIFGTPNQDPQRKPRMGEELRIFENAYPSSMDWLEALQSYDREMTRYADPRTPDTPADPFTDQVVKKLEGMVSDSRTPLDAIARNGFSLGQKEE